MFQASSTVCPWISLTTATGTPVLHAYLVHPVGGPGVFFYFHAFDQRSGRSAILHECLDLSTCHRILLDGGRVVHVVGVAAVALLQGPGEHARHHLGPR